MCEWLKIVDKFLFSEDSQKFPEVPKRTTPFPLLNKQHNLSINVILTYLLHGAESFLRS